MPLSDSKWVAIFLAVENIEMENVAVIEANEEKGRTMGPVDYILVRFPGNKFNGKIIPELMRLEKNGFVRVIDLVLVVKDSNGKVFITEAEDLKGDIATAYAEIAKNTKEWFYEGDINAISDNLPNDSSAALLLFENVWAIKFKEALIDSEAELIDMGRISPEVIEKVQNLMEQGGA
jgi:predicted RND superfamily exporter protein